MNDNKEIQVKNNALAPANFTELMSFAELVANTQLVPANFRGKPADIVVACQYGNEVGLHPMQAINHIAVINGKPSMYGDALLALVKRSAAFEWIKETVESTEDDRIARCVIKRQGEPEAEYTFSWLEAKQAGLTNKSGPWKTYPKRMLQMRARGFALRDVFPDVLMGLISAEEAHDYPVKNITPKDDFAPIDDIVTIREDYNE